MGYDKINKQTNTLYSFMDALSVDEFNVLLSADEKLYVPAVSGVVVHSRSSIGGGEGGGAVVGSGEVKVKKAKMWKWIGIGVVVAILVALVLSWQQQRREEEDKKK